MWEGGKGLPKRGLRWVGAWRGRLDGVGCRCGENVAGIVGRKLVFEEVSKKEISGA
jgi:hypothetical protein